jgi:predicted peptidase
MKRAIPLLLMLLCTGFAVSAFATLSASDQAIADKFVRRSHTLNGVATLPYRLFIPANYSKTKSYPLVLTLHGGGERGNDNNAQITGHILAVVWARDSNQTKNQCFVLSPQMPSGANWAPMWEGIVGSYSLTLGETNPMKVAMAILDSMRREFSIDSTRIYVTGYSRGGYGTWDAVERFPKIFAAGGAMAGGGDSSLAVVRGLSDVAMWAFHCQDDNTVQPAGSRQMMAAFAKIGRVAAITNYNIASGSGPNLSNTQMDSLMKTSPKLLYSEYLNGGHEGSWHAVSGYPNAMRGYDNSFFINWMMAQHKTIATTTSQPASSKAVLGVTTEIHRAMVVKNKCVLTRQDKNGRVSVYSFQGKYLGNADGRGIR